MIGISIPETEDERIGQMAAQVKLTKSELARAMFRAGQILYKENTNLVLSYVSTRRTID
jgi:hypothetical protein